MEGAKRPLALSLCAYLLIFSMPFFAPDMGSWLSLALAGLLSLLLVLFFLFFFPKRRKGTRHFLALCGVLLCLFGFLGGRHFVLHRIKSVERLADGSPRYVTGVVREVIYDEAFASSVYVDLRTVDGEKASGAIALTLPFRSGLSPYDKVNFTAVLTENAEDFDAYLRARSVFLSAEAEDFRLDGTEKRDIMSFTREARRFISEAFDRLMGGKAGGFGSALLTGDRERLDGQTALAFKRLGISHLLAVSGLHLSVLIGGLDLLLRKLTVAKRLRRLLLLLAMALFVTVCGFSASVLRAAVMLCLFYLSELLGERHDPLTALFAAVALIVTLRPVSVYDGALWLSFFATLGILLVLPLSESFLGKAKRTPAVRLLRYIVTLLLMTLTATFFTLPVLFLFDGSISLLSPLANLIFVPAVSLILYLLVLILLFSWVPVLPTLLGTACRFLIETFSCVAEALADNNDICVSLNLPFAGYIIAFFVVGLALLLFVGRFRPKRLLALFLAFCIAYFGAYGVYRLTTRGDIRIFLCHEGKNDTVGFVHDGRAVLVDVTAGGKLLPLEAMDALDSLGVCETDLFVLTHLHANHIATLPRLADRMKLHRVLLPEAETEEEASILASICTALEGICEVSLYPRDGESHVTVGRLRIRLPRYETLPRSAHPVILFSAEAKGMEKPPFVYIGASAFELSDTAEKANAVLAVCGTHGPVTKNLFAASDLDSAETVLFCDSDLSRFTWTERIGGEVIVLDKGRFDLLITK